MIIKQGGYFLNEYTIVVPDNDVLTCVCGTNDSNLKLIEESLGTDIFTKGNELSISNENPSKFLFDNNSLPLFEDIPIEDNCKYDYKLICPKCLRILLIVGIDIYKIKKEIELHCDNCGNFELSIEKFNKIALSNPEDFSHLDRMKELTSNDTLTEESILSIPTILIKLYRSLILFVISKLKGVYPPICSPKYLSLIHTFAI